MNKEYKIFSIMLLITAFIPTFLLSMINYIVDPYQVAHKHWLTQPSFSNNQRYQNVGLIKNYDFDSAIIGSSLSANSKVTDANKIPGFTKTIKLTTYSTYAEEMGNLVTHIIKNKNIKNIIWEIHIESVSGSLKRTLNKKYTFPDFLYDDSIVNDIEYFANIDTFKLSYNVLRGKTNWANDFDNMYSWFTDSIKWGLKSNQIQSTINDTKKWYKSEAKDNTMGRYRLEILYGNFDSYIHPILKKYQDINFYIIFPPYSILSYSNKAARDKKLFDNIFLFRKAVANDIDKLPNTRLYGFESVESIVEDINNYKDPNHYHPTVNSFILNAIAENRYELSSKNITAHDDNFKQRIMEWLSSQY